MSNSKALILGILLLVPLLIFIFIGSFGEHHYTLPKYFPQVTATGEVQRDAKGDTLFNQVPAFQLTSQQGQAISQKDLDGHIYVADFFFATCPDICKAMSSQMVRVQEAFQDEEQVKLVSFTVNPEYDTPEVLREYGERYGADPGKWYFLTGDRDKIYTLAQKGFYLPVMKVEGQQDFIHSEKFMLVDKDRYVRGIYDGTDKEDVDRLIIEIKVLLDEYSKSK
ncbi:MULTISPECIES: SCO family protein [Pontibacter]|uniref:Protein SCO1/2 n=1 Tax=Pontibacter lucknowensis TaxID=1077936 RepID=A0A1N6SYI8_9BACT|nr:MULTISPECIES: SCO family protein [Pontibacter]EJF08634.1 electron transporter SCO1/SenC [Pontibacter sp. BAB1700]SIQ46047.1 protein SCO1/2 [Pontibacter lucknowensis]